MKKKIFSNFLAAAAQLFADASAPHDSRAISQSPDAPISRNSYFGGGASPKDYGLYLLRSGKNKYNTRKRKHIAKAFSR